MTDNWGSCTQVPSLLSYVHAVVLRLTGKDSTFPFHFHFITYYYLFPIYTHFMCIIQGLNHEMIIKIINHVCKYNHTY